ncbi:hypothetical protein CRU99_10125, partial [Malaciobacter mytili]|uniref:response regulator n=1 Tax=Malaciobacter mytili TaxID=603050 RepID=UPI0010285213
MRVLLIEKNIYLANSLLINFEMNNFFVTHKEEITSEIFEEIFNYDICILDNSIEDGLYTTSNFLKTIKELGNNIPIIISSSFLNFKEILMYLHEGCIDYIHKPFSFEELQLRIH